MDKDRVSFNVRLLAGVTHMRPESPGRIERPNGMDGWILNRTVEGVGRIRGGPQDILAKPGEMLLFPPDVPHLYGYEPEAGLWVHQWIYFFPRAPWLEWMRWPSLPPGVMRVKLDGDLWETAGRIFDNAIKLSKSSAPLQFELAMNSLENLILHCELANPGRKGPNLDARMEKAIRHMEMNLSKGHSLESLAKDASLSKSRFSHLFQESLGLSPMEHLESLRIRHAKELLFISSKTLAEIADECGFQNAFYFSRVFKKTVGIPPGQFRERILR